jgi:hypothetical protein
VEKRNMSSDNYVSVQRLINNLEQFRDGNYYIKEIREAEATVLWKNPRSGKLTYAGVVDLFTGKVVGGLDKQDKVW